MKENLAGFITHRNEIARGRVICVSCGYPIEEASAKIELHLECHQKERRIEPPATELEAWLRFQRLNGFAGELDQPPKLNESKRSSNPPSQAAEPVVKCGYGLSDERSHGKTTDTGRDSADCVGVCDERHATE